MPISHALHLDVHRRPFGDGLEDHAIALGELEQLVELVLRRVGLDLEGEADRPEADRRVLVDAERAAEIEIALGRDGAASAGSSSAVATAFRVTPAQATSASSSMSPEQSSSAGAAGRRMQARDREGAAGLDLAGDALVVERALAPSA